MKGCAVVVVGQSRFSGSAGLLYGSFALWPFTKLMEGINLKRERIGASIVCFCIRDDKQRSLRQSFVIMWALYSTQF